jgi:integrase
VLSDAGVHLGTTQDNPLDSIGWRVPQSSAALDPVVVASPAQVSALLDAVTRTRPEMTAFFGCLYYAALRPEEAVALRFADCRLPGSGWGMLRLAAATPRTAAAWTSSGTSHEQRGLKHRPDGAIRMVPVPPVLAAMLRAHHAAYGTGPDGRLFRGTRGGPLSESVYGRAWHRPRSGPRARASRQRAGPAPYDLRHAALSLWLNAGGDPAQIAAQAGNSVAVLLTAYSHCIHGQDDLLNQQIGHVLEPSAGRGPCPSVGKPAVVPTARLARTPSAMRPWIPLPARRRPVDHTDTKRTHPETATLATVVFPDQGKY